MMAKKKPLPALSNDDKLNNTMFYILLALLLFVPLIIFPAKVQHVSPFIINNELTGEYDDSVLYAKFLGLTIGGFGLMVLYLTDLFKNRKLITFNFYLIPATLMIFLVSLSVLFSDYKTDSIFGRFQVREGALTFLAYLFIYLVSAGLSYTEQKLKLVVKALYLIVAVNVILVVGDFYQVLSVGVASTFGNVNYISGMSGVFTAFLVSMAVLNKDLKNKMINGLFAAFSFLTVLCSVSLSGFVTFAAMLPLLIFVIWSTSQWRNGMLSLGAILLLFSAIFLAVNATDSRVWNNSIGFFIKPPVTTGEQTGTVAPQKETGEKPVVEKNANSAGLSDNDDLSLPPSGWGAGTGRLYIWGKTFDLIKARPVLGYGFDTIVYFFPQFDRLKTANLFTADYFVDKTHNLYLTIAFGSGIFSLLAFLALILFHTGRCFKLIVKKQLTNHGAIFTSLFIAFIAYLLQALVNDPMIPGGIIFWAFFGISCSMIRQTTASSVTKAGKS